MSAELSFNSNIVQILLVIGIAILVGGYFYYENIKIKNQILEFEYELSKINKLIKPNNLNGINELNEFSDFQNKVTPEINTVQMDSIQQDGSFDLFIPNVKDCVDKETLVNTSKRVTNNDISSTELIKMVDEKKTVEVSGDLDKNTDWEDINKQMKNNSTDNVIIDSIVDSNDDSNGDSNVDLNMNSDNDPEELKSFSIDDMLKDIENDTNNKETNKIIDMESGTDYQNMTVSQLKDILLEKNLPVSGNKTKLIKRILDNDK
jgi:hypothetical protein